MFEVPIQIRFRDLDAYSHVNSAVYFTYMEQARVELLRKYDLLNRFVLSDMIVVAHSECTFKKPITLDVDLKIKLYIENVGNSSFDIVYIMHDGKLEYAVGRTKMVYLDGGTKKPKMISEEFRAILEEFKK